MLKLFLNKWFSLYFLSSALSMIGTQIYRFAIPWLVLKMTGSITSMSTMYIVEFLPHIIIGPFLGAVIDRFNRKKLMLFADLSRFLLVLCIPILAILNVLEIWELYVTGFLLTVLSICFELLSDFGLIPKLVKEKDLPNANSAYIAISNISTLVGPILAGVFIAIMGAEKALLFDAISYLITFIVILFLPINLSSSKNQKSISFSDMMDEVKQGYRYIKRTDILRSLALVGFLKNLATCGLLTVVTYRLGEELHLKSEMVGTIFSAVGVAALVGSIFASVCSKWFSLGKNYTIGTFIAMMGAVFMASMGWKVGMIGFALMNLAESFGNVYTYTIRQYEIPDRIIGIVNASYRMIIFTSIPISSFLLGWLTKHEGYNVACIFSAVILIISSIVVWKSQIPSYKHQYILE